MLIDPYRADRVWKLPPLILHPFSDATSPQKLVQSSRASLMLQGLLPTESYDVEQLQTILLDGRYCEVRILFYVGKDLVRWIDQCTEVVESRAAPASHRDRMAKLFQPSGRRLSPARPQQAPAVGSCRLQSHLWACNRSECCLLRMRRTGQLANDFIRNYHQFADHMFACGSRQRGHSHSSGQRISSSNCLLPASTHACWKGNGRNSERPYIIHTWSFPLFS